MNTLQAFVLGAVQGIAEFLPISSSGHLILVPAFFKWQDPGLAFDVFLHLGTLFAIFVYFFRDWWRVANAGLQSILERRIGYDRDRQTFWFLVVGSVPGALAGAVLNHAAEELFRAPLLVAVTMASLGFLLYWIDGKYPALRNFEELKMKDAVIIGCAQAFAIVPGVSRSGSTMTAARLLGLNREASARFSFLLAFPITLGAVLFEARKFTGETLHSMSSSYLIVAFSASVVFGFLSIHFLLQYLRNADFKVFAWYRVVLAGFTVIWSLLWGG
jgi:undecaprenyl-diphosphatase